MSGGKLENRRKPVSLARGSWHIFDPRFARSAATGEWGGVAAAQLFSGELLGKLHYQAVLDETDKHLPTGVAGRKTEHPPAAEAAMMFDEMDEKWLKIGSKRNRHADERL